MTRGEGAAGPLVRRARFAASSIVALACGSSPSAANLALEAGVHQDAGGESGLACVGEDVFCGAVCQKESVAACGTSCTVCAQPATSHGMADCQSHSCTFSCEGGYTSCGTESCCGTQTDGDVVAMAVGGETSCGVTSAGALFCWGDGSYGVLGDGLIGDQSSLPQAVSALASSVVSLALGDHHGCVLLSDQTVRCWGDDLQGQLGDGQRTPRATPSLAVALAQPVTSVATGGLHTCAVTGAGALFCWGDNTRGQLGVPAAGSSSAEPVAVTGLSSAVAGAAAGEAFTCAQLTSGQVQCWGDGSNGQLGGPMSSTTPVVIGLLPAVKAIAAGAHHACAVTLDGTVMCWGAGAKNQLGVQGGSAQSVPSAVPALKAVSSIAAGGDETCAIDSGGAVTCWGADPVGDVGIGPGGPAIVPSLTGGIARVAVVAGHACAVTTGGAPKCWGKNNLGELGDGTMTASWAPIDITGF